MKIIKKSKIISLFILFAIFSNAIQATQINNQKEKPKTSKQETKPKQEKKNYKNLIIYSSIAIIMTAILLEIGRRDQINTKSLLEKESRSNNYKNIIIASVTTILAIILIDFFIKVNDNNQHNSYFVKTLLMTKKIANFCKNSFKNLTQKKENTNTFTMSAQYATTCEAKAPTNTKIAWPVEAAAVVTPVFIPSLSNTSAKLREISVKPIPLHSAILRGDVAAVTTMVENGADIWEKDSEGLRPIEIAYKERQDEIEKILIKNGACAYLSPHCTIPDWTPTFHLKINMDPKFTLHNNGKRKYQEYFIATSVEIINNKTTTTYEKQSALYYFFLEHKNFNREFELNQVIELVGKIQFNHRFFTKNKFKDIREYAIQNNLKDVSNNTVLMASAKFCKDHKLIFKLLMKAYYKYSHLGNKEAQEKEILKNEIKATLENARKINRKLYNQMRNIDLIWCDLEYENLLNKTKPKNKERLEPEFVKNIIELIGIDGINDNKVYFK